MEFKSKTLSYSIKKETHTEFKRICNTLSIEVSFVAQHLFKLIIANNGYKKVFLNKASSSSEVGICTSIRVRKELMRFPHKVNVNATLNSYIESFNIENKDKKITDIPEMPELKFIFIKSQ